MNARIILPALILLAGCAAPVKDGGAFVRVPTPPMPGELAAPPPLPLTIQSMDAAASTVGDWTGPRWQVVGRAAVPYWTHDDPLPPGSLMLSTNLTDWTALAKPGGRWLVVVGREISSEPVPLSPEVPPLKLLFLFNAGPSWFWYYQPE